MAVQSITSRGIWAGALAATFLLSAFGAEAWAETLRVGKAFPSAFGFVPIDVGVEEGIFKKQGLEIEITSLGGAPALIQAITAGSIDIGLESGTDLGMIPKGFPVKGVGATMGPPLEIKERKVRTCRSARARTLLCRTRSSSQRTGDEHAHYRRISTALSLDSYWRWRCSATCARRRTPAGTHGAAASHFFGRNSVV